MGLLLTMTEKEGRIEEGGGSVHFWSEQHSLTAVVDDGEDRTSWEPAFLFFSFLFFFKLKQLLKYNN